MAASSFWQLEHEYYALAKPHDVIIRVVTYDMVAELEPALDGTVKQIQRRAANKVHEFKCKRDTVMSNSFYLSRYLYQGDETPKSDVVDLYEPEVNSLEVWLKLLHGCDVHSTLTSTDLKGVWRVLATAYHYNFDPKSPAAKAWFESWFGANTQKSETKWFDYRDFQALLYPCMLFDYAEGFRQATRYLAYRSIGDIKENKPDSIEEENLVLGTRVMLQLNAAKNRLKLILHRAIHSPIDLLLTQPTCDCKATALYTYELALAKTGAWPFETSFISHSIMEILNKLETFPGNTKGPKMCEECSIDFKDTVSKAISDTREKFDGLCLDCMNFSDPSLDTDKKLYWKRTESHGNWDQGCRVHHGQPSWYFSFMGDRMDMTEYLNKASKTSAVAEKGRGRRDQGRGRHSGSINWPPKAARDLKRTD